MINNWPQILIFSIYRDQQYHCLIQMTFMNDLKPGDIARIVTMNNGSDLINRFGSTRLRESYFIEILSCCGNIIFKSNDKTFVIGKGLAEKIRVIPLNKTNILER